MFEEAEQAYRQSLAIRVQMRDLPGQADTLLELGHLYRAMDRLEEAAIFYQQAADIYVGLRDLFREGQTRSNLAATLIQLQRYDNARQELLRAIETMQPYGHAAEPWEIWMTLHGLELATNNVEAAVEARGRAIEAYLAYRRAGGENRNPGAQLCAQVFQAIQSVRTAEVEQRLTESLDSDVPPWAQALFPKLIAILQGDRDPALADDPSLDYDDAAELILLLEALKI
jgi:tetratricopeptide (TPR) repeat protein